MSSVQVRLMRCKEGMECRIVNTTPRPEHSVLMAVFFCSSLLRDTCPQDAGWQVSTLDTTCNTPQKCCFHRPSQSRCDLLRTSWEDTSLLTVKTPWSGRVPHEAVNIPEEYNNGDGHRLLCHCRHPCLFVVCRRVRVINDSALRNAHLATRQVTSSVCCGKKGNWPPCTWCSLLDESRPLSMNTPLQRESTVS